MTKHYRVTLQEGATDTNRYGTFRKGVPFRIPGSDTRRLAFFQRHGRYQVEELKVPKRSTTPAQSSVGRDSKSGPKPGMPITEERLRALAEMSVAGKNKKQLINIARDLGLRIDPRDPPTNRQLEKMITDRQTEVLAEMEGDDSADDE